DAVNRRRGQRGLAQRPGHAVVADAGDQRGGAPGGAAVEAGERADRAGEGLVGDDHGAVGLYGQLPAETTGGAADRPAGRAPGEAAVGGGLHLDGVTGAGDVVLGVTVPEVRAGRGVVADGPVLVIGTG